MATLGTALDTADWRFRIFELYAEVRRVAASDPAAAHRIWRDRRDELFATHPASPLLPEDAETFSGLPVADYDPSWRFEVDVAPVDEGRDIAVPTGTDGVVGFTLIGSAELPGNRGSLAVWKHAGYGGGLFVPVKDRLAGADGGTYGGGRYLLDTIKGAHLGTAGASDAGSPDHGAGAGRLVLDLNFAYNPSCAYDPAWACPLAQLENTLPVEVPVGETYPVSRAH